MADTLRDLAYGAALRGQMPAPPMTLPDTIARLAMQQGGSVGTPYRTTLADMVGRGGAAAQRLAQALDTVGVRVPGTQARISLKDLTLGDAGQVVEDWSYGSPPMRGGNYATGGVGTLGPTQQAMELLNLGGVAGGAAKAGQVGARVLGPTLKEMVREGGESFMRGIGAQQDLITWHGSPHTFDRFDSSKIGTGEGAQAYGHGLYLAESPEVAKSYQKTLSSENGFLLDGQKLSRKEVQDILNSETAGYLDGIARPSGVADYLMDALSNSSFGKPNRYAAGSERSAYYDALQKRLSKEDTGSLYKVDLPDSMIARMLDWDKPLSAQPMAVRDAVSPLLKDAFDVRSYGGGWGSLEPDASVLRDVFTKSGHPLGSYAAQDADNLNFTGSAIVKALGNMDKQSAKTSQMLRAAGIPGIKYFDGVSRRIGDGSSNFVVFPGEENALTILERNGRPLR